MTTNNNQDEASSTTHLVKAVVLRVVGDTLVYARVSADDFTFTITPESIASYRGESFAEIGLAAGATILCSYETGLPVITKIQPLDSVLRVQGAKDVSAQELQQGPPVRSQPGASQIELHPNDLPTGTIVAPRALPQGTRKFGKLVNTDILKPGDLILTREIDPTDNLSKLITKVQSSGGYHEDDARWTHAAMYLGDNASLIEATVDGFLSGGSVRITSLDEYCNGASALRFRRSRFIEHENDGWKVCVRALSRLNEPYNIFHAVKLWFDTIVSGIGFFNTENNRRAVSSAVVCSTLYADSYNEATRRTLGELSGACVPAWLSVSDEFYDVESSWLHIR